MPLENETARLRHLNAQFAATKAVQALKADMGAAVESTVPMKLPGLGVGVRDLVWGEADAIEDPARFVFGVDLVAASNGAIEVVLPKDYFFLMFGSVRKRQVYNALVYMMRVATVADHPRDVDLEQLRLHTHAVSEELLFAGFRHGWKAP